LSALYLPASAARQAPKERTVPTILRIGPFRFFFYANENDEPPHIHVQRDRALAKFWLQPVALVRSTGFAPHDLSKLAKLVEEQQPQLEEAWNAFFGN
jgi:hypothetical protein